jgi:hypothetical protein
MSRRHLQPSRSLASLGDAACLLRATPWVVYAKRPFGGPEQVLDYLGRYTHRVAIANSRLVGFIEGRFHRIRHYGYLANGHRAAKLADCRRLLAAPELAPLARAADYRERYQQLTGRSLDLCPCCGGRMIEIGVIPRASTFATADPWNTS